MCVPLRHAHRISSHCVDCSQRTPELIYSTNPRHHRVQRHAQNQNRLHLSGVWRTVTEVARPVSLVRRLEQLSRRGRGPQERQYGRALAPSRRANPSGSSTSTTTLWPGGIGELDRVLGGGLVPGSLVLVGGTRASANPRCCCKPRRGSPRAVAKCSTSPASQQTRMRFNRVGAQSDSLCSWQRHAEQIQAHVDQIKPASSSSTRSRRSTPTWCSPSLGA